jgi:hypothetical protein
MCLNHAHSIFSLCLPVLAGAGYPDLAGPDGYPDLASTGAKAGFLIGT